MNYEFKVYISKHPSGGFILNLPLLAPNPVQVTMDKIIKLIIPFSVWTNNPSIPNHIELEFPNYIGDNDINQFSNWVRWTIGVHVPEGSLMIERI